MNRDAFVFGPTRTIQSAINEGNGCGYCGKLFLGKASSIIVPCTAHDSILANGGLAPTAANGQRKVSAGKRTTRSVSSSGTGKKGAQAESQLAANAVQAVAAGKGSSCSLKFCNKLCRDRCEPSCLRSGTIAQQDKLTDVSVLLWSNSSHRQRIIQQPSLPCRQPVLECIPQVER